MWKLWKARESKDKYLDAKQKERHAVYTAKRNAEKEKFSGVKDNKENIFCVTKQMYTESQDVIGEKCIRGDDGNFSLDDAPKKLAWKQHYERLLNIEFPWSQNLPYVDPVAGPAQFITPNDVLKSLRHMKDGKVAGPSGVVAEVLKAAPDICSKIIADLMNAIICDGKFPADWSDKIIVSLFKGKRDALDQNNYRGLKLTDHVLKDIERVVKSIIFETVNIDEMQFGFCPGRGTTDAIFILTQLQELYMAFVDLEKAFNRVPWKVLWWALRFAGVPEWLVKVGQAMYVGARSRARVNSSFSEEFEVKVGVHQGSVLIPLLFIIVLEAISREFCVGCPWKMLYADGLVILAETFEGIMTKMAVWKNGLESKGLKVNMGKTKVMISGRDLHTLQTSGKYPCALCRKGVGKNSIFCSGCSFWVHKKCSDIPGRLVEDPDFRCRRYLGNARAIDGRP